MTEKPPYSVPSMAEVAATPWNGFNVVSTFSGAGGSCLGYRMAGFRVLWANEFVPAARETYKANHPGSILDARDIRTVEPESILSAIGIKQGELDLLDGSPPCASFSTAGIREAGWGKVKQYSDTKQRVDDLFFEYVRILRGLKPKVFIAENVSGLVKGTAKGYFLEILRELKGSGYNVKAKVLDAQWLGVPQMRKRVIFLGVRSDLGLEPAFPQPLPYRYSVKDAIPWIARQGDNAAFGGGSLRDAELSASPTIGANPQTGNGRFPPSLVEVITGIEDANGYYKHAEYSPDRPMDTISAQRPERVSVQIKQGNKNGHSSCRGERVSLSSPSPTIIAGGGSGQFVVERDADCSPTERRRFSIAELRRICAFPDDFLLTGTYAQQWERLGRAVPPLMMKAIAETVRDEILCRLK